MNGHLETIYYSHDTKNDQLVNTSSKDSSVSEQTLKVWRVCSGWLWTGKLCHIFLRLILVGLGISTRHLEASLLSVIFYCSGISPVSKHLTFFNYHVTP